jgi:hypothetical protein
MTSAEIGLPADFEPGKRRRDRLGVDPSTAKNVLWVARLGSENYSSPTIAGGRVYVGTNDEALDDPRFSSTRGGVLLCLDEATGSLLWKLVVPPLQIDRMKVSEDFDDMNLGICSSATVEGDRVYLVSNRCEVLCLDVDGLANGNDGPFRDEARFSVADGQPPIELGSADADILWRFDMVRQLPVFPHDATNCSVLVQGDFVYAGTGNGVNDGKIMLPSAPSLIVLDKRTGKLVAKDDGGISAGVFHGQWSSPSLGTVGGRSLVFFGGGDGWCHAFEPIAAASAQPTLLKSVWHFDANPPGYRSRNGRPIDYWALVRGGVREFIEGDRIVSPSEIIGTPAFCRNRVYVTIGQDPVHGPGAGALSCIAADGHGDITHSGCVWQYHDIGRSLSTVAVAGGLVFAAEHAGKIHCLDAETGRVYWVHNTGDEIWSSTLVADGKLYIGTRRGLVVLAADRQERALANIRLGSPVWSAPTAAGGVLFVASQRNLWAVKEKGEMPPGN